MTEEDAWREAADSYCLRPGESEALLDGHPWHRFAVVGDSVAEGVIEFTAGYRDVPWGDRIADALRECQPGLAYLNLGTRNLRAAEVREKQLGSALAFGPDLALVVCGGYDLFQARHHPDSIRRELSTIVSAIRERGSDVITVGMFDVSYSPYVPERYRPLLRQRLRTLTGQTEAVAAEHGALYVGLTAHPAAESPDLYSSDGRHGSARGHAIAAAECVRHLGAHLGRTFPAR